MTTTLQTGQVQLLRWPAETARRDRCKALGILRLLVVEGGAPAPICSDVREDWVRAPVSREDLMARVAGLRARSEAHRMPHIDPNGVLRYGGRYIAISPTETDLLGCLVRRFGALVPRSMLRECLPERPSSSSRNALDLHIMRLRRRIQPLGLVVRTVWGHGYVLEAVDTPPTETANWERRQTRRAGSLRPAQAEGWDEDVVVARQPSPFPGPRRALREVGQASIADAG